MYLERLSLLCFKNYLQAELEFSPRINCFTGLNGVGKTNLLDAVYYLSLTKSYFNPIDTQNITHNQEALVIQGDYRQNGDKFSVYCGIRRSQKKQFRLDTKEYQKLSDHIGKIPVVMIAPEDSSLITEGSEERRKFINGVISQYDRLYLEDLVNYNHALIQRNKLLKDLSRNHMPADESIEIWNEQLIPLAQRIHSKRFNYTQQLIPVFQKYYQFISSGKEKVELVYHSQLTGEDYRKLLENSLSKDLLLQYTSTGIHKDDLQLLLNGNPIKRIGSQGQQKTYLVSLKLAQFDFIQEHNGITPILLLDDIFDKFDSTRVQQIIHLVSEHHTGQIFIADTNKSRIETVMEGLSSDYRIFEITPEETRIISTRNAEK